MNKKTFFIILAVVIVLAGIIYFYQGDKSADTNIPNGTKNTFPASNQEKSAAKTTPGAQTTSKTYVVNLSDTGPDLRALDISSGDTVKFVNTGTRPYWVASDPHTTHSLCPGFDSSHGLIHNESWSHTFKFAAPKTCPYHNHLDITTAWYAGTINIK